ncbi:MAG: hypothetical protein ABMA25_02800 [Ilumatobacteraceae bacterium]
MTTAVTSGVAAASPANPYPPGCAVVTTNASSYAPGAVITLTAQGEPTDAGAMVTFTITLTNGGPIDLPSLRAVPQGHGLGFSGGIVHPQSSTTSIVLTAIVDANGTAVVTVTAPLTIGNYTVTITNINCGEVSSSFVITPDVPVTTTTQPGFPPGTTPGRVPSAGSNVEPRLVGATVLVASGLMLWVATRRRRQSSLA